MKLFFILALCAVLSVSPVLAGSMTLLGAGKPAAGGCTEATNFLARTSGLNGTHTTAYTTLICGLVTDGVFAKLDVLYIFATDTTTNALLNLVQNNFNATISGTLTFAADVGYTGTGTPNYMDSGFSPLNSAGHFTQNSASIGAYVRTSRTVDQGYVSLGTSNGNFTLILPQGQFSDLFNYAVNSVAVNTVASTNSQGQWIASRTASNAIAAQKNGAAFDSASNVSGGVDSSNILVFANNSTGASAFSLDQQSAIVIGGGLTGTEMTNLAARINAYMTTFSINVY